MQHLIRRTIECNRVRVSRNNRASRDRHFVAAARCRAQRRYLVGVGHISAAQLGNQSSNLRCVIRFCRHNACGRLQVSLARKQPCRTVVCRDAHIFKCECSHKEALLVRERIKGRPNPCSHRRSIEAVCQINLRSADRGRTQGTAEKPHMRQFIVRDLHCVLLNCRSRKRHLRSACDRSRASPRVRIRKTRSGRRPQIELCFEVFKIQRKIKNVRVCQHFGRSLRSRVCSAAAATCGDRQCRGRPGAQTDSC